MPRLWNDTIDAHRQAVRDATLDATASLVADHGLASVTMSRIAEETGIGRATLYKYFPDIDAILLAWHERQIARHLELLAAAADREGTPVDRLEAVLRVYADVAYRDHSHDLVSLLHRGKHVAQAEKQLHSLVRDLIAEGVRAGEIRADVTADELARYCLHALSAAGDAPSRAAVHRLVDVTLAGLRSQP